MKLQIKPERWQCAVTSFAMALDVDVLELMQFIGHNGGQLMNADLAIPFCYRGHHLQELIECCLLKGYAVTPIEIMPAIKTGGNEYLIDFGGGKAGNLQRFVYQVRTSVGVIEGKSGSSPHMLAYDHGTVYDPDGGTWEFSPQNCLLRGFTVLQLWRIDRIK